MLIACLGLQEFTVMSPPLRGWPITQSRTQERAFHAITHTKKSKKDLSRITHKVDSPNPAISFLIFTQSRTITQEKKANNAITHTYGGPPIRLY